MIKVSGIAASLVTSLLVCGVANANQIVIDPDCTGTNTGGNGGNGGNGGTVTPPIVTPPPPIVIPVNPRFTAPNIDFVTHQDCAAQLKNGVLSFTVNSVLGDSFAIDQGKGFSPATGTLIVNSGLMSETSTASQLTFASGGTVSLLTGGHSQIVGELGALTLVKTDLGYTFSAAFQATGGALKPGFPNNGGFFGLLYNLHDVTAANGIPSAFCASAKGDLAAIAAPTPPVPEPATLALVAMSLGGLFASARRRIH